MKRGGEGNALFEMPKEKMRHKIADQVPRALARTLFDWLVAHEKPDLLKFFRSKRPKTF